MDNRRLETGRKTFRIVLQKNLNVEADLIDLHSGLPCFATRWQGTIKRFRLSCCSLGVLLIPIIFLSCQEDLPTYQTPENVLRIDQVLAFQEYDRQQGIKIKIAVIGRNYYEETLEDSVNLRGQVFIRWKDKPEFTATLGLDNSHIVHTNIRNGMLRLDPMQDFEVQTQWLLNTDSGHSFMDICAPAISTWDGDKIWSDPETFLFDVRFAIYDGYGELVSRNQTFELTVWEYWEPMF